jgi:hypothetical protein
MKGRVMYVALLMTALVTYYITGFDYLASFAPCCNLTHGQRQPLATRVTSRVMLPGECFPEMVSSPLARLWLAVGGPLC